MPSDMQINLKKFLTVRMLLLSMLITFSKDIFQFDKKENVINYNAGNHTNRAVLFYLSSESLP